MRPVGVLLFTLLAPLAHGQAATDDDLANAFGPPAAARVFEPEHNVPPPPLPEDLNAALRANFERDLAAAQQLLETGQPAAARDQLVLVELGAVALGGPERVRVHRVQRAAAQKLDDRRARAEADQKWLGACGPNEVARCRAEALQAIAAYDRPRADRVRAADACLTSAEGATGATLPGCLESALALYRKADDPLMVGRVELLRATRARPDKATRKSLVRLAGLLDDRSAPVRRAALELLSRLELAEGAVDDALRDAILASGAWASTLPLASRWWARSPALDAACAEYEKTRRPGTCRPLEKQLLGDYVFHDFSTQHLGEGQLISHELLVAVNQHYGVLVQNCLAAEINSLERAEAFAYRVRWLVTQDGRVDNFHSDGTQQDQSRFVTCLRNQFGYWRYPAHEGDPQRIEQTFTVRSTTHFSEQTEPQRAPRRWLRCHRSWLTRSETGGEGARVALDTIGRCLHAGH